MLHQEQQIKSAMFAHLLKMCAVIRCAQLSVWQQFAKQDPVNKCGGYRPEVARRLRQRLKGAKTEPGRLDSHGGATGFHAAPAAVGPHDRANRTQSSDCNRRTSESMIRNPAMLLLPLLLPEGEQAVNFKLQNWAAISARHRRAARTLQSRNQRALCRRFNQMLPSTVTEVSLPANQQYFVDNGLASVCFTFYFKTFRGDHPSHAS